jgi:xanthine dehydrogenase accessory factor
VYLEPVVPAPLVVAVGDSPAVSTLAGLARELGWRVATASGADDFDATAVDAGTAVVVATQGHDDEAALQAALRTPAGYIGLVASRQRADVTFGYLRDRGVADADLDRVQAPAGLDLGSTDHREIAVAVLAELVARRARGELRKPVAAAAAAPATAVDPICGMTVDAVPASHPLEVDGTTYYFCSLGCRAALESRQGA